MKVLKGKLFVFFIIIVIILFFNKYKVYADEKKDVLFISSYNPNFITFNDQVLGIEDTMNDDVQLQIEYMDFRTFSDEKNEKNFYDLLKYKINNYRTFDAIILGDDEALRFGMKYKEELFGDIPVVFFAVSNMDNLNKAIDEYGMLGIAEIQDVEENLKLALKLNKQAKNIVFLDGSRIDVESNDVGKSIDKEMIDRYALEYPNINFKEIYTEDLEYEEFIDLLKGFTEDDIVISIYPHLFKNKNKISHKDFIKAVADNINSNVPIYTVINYGIGDGFLGGLLTSHFREGQEAGKIVSKILNNESLDNLSIRDNSINEYIFDYNKLKDLKIKKDELPKGSVIINKPILFFQKYKELIVPISLTIVGLVLIIILLILYSLNQKRYEKKILEAKLLAEDANRAKDHFISNISHELRTPVAIIVSATQLLRLKIKYENSEKNSAFDRLNIIDKNCYRLMRLINNIIDIAKVDANFMKLNLKNLNAIEILEDLVMSVIPYAENKNINIIFDTQEEEVIMALDKEKIERIVLNLLSNAIKFSKEGGDIFINTYIEDKNLVFYVADNGIGIEKENLDKIFERFIQVDNTMTRKNEGSGIGLSLVKSFVKLHNGEIYVESKPKHGSKFTVKLPIKLVKEDSGENKNLDEDKSKDMTSTKVEFSDIYF